jgi:protein-tyrosine phosphatase
LDSPLRVAFVAPELHGGSGALGLTFAPGKKDVGLEVVWDRDLAADLGRLREVYRTDVLVSLIEDHELSLLRIEGLFEQADKLGIEVLRLPIQDGMVPEDPGALAALVRQVAAALQAGRCVVVHCRGGLGRAGLVTAAILVGHGRSSALAIAEVRKVRPGAIENRLQEEFMDRFAEDWHERP